MLIETGRKEDEMLKAIERIRVKEEDQEEEEVKVFPQI